MKKSYGVILPIALMLITVLLLLTSLMHLINRQYQAEIEVVDDMVVVRQSLLLAGKSILQNLGSRNEEKFIEWPDCNPFTVPELLLSASSGVRYQQAKLDKRCGFGYQAYRVWLANNEARDTLLVLDALVQDQAEWGEKIAEEDESVVVEFKSERWLLQITDKYQSQFFFIFNDEDTRLLKYQQVRKYKGEYEFVLLFENTDKNFLELYRLIVNINESILSAIYELPIEVLQLEGYKKFSSPQLHGQSLKNWTMSLRNQVLTEILLYNQVIFLAFTQNSDVGMVAIGLDGQPFFGVEILGVQQRLQKGVMDEHIAIACDKETPLVVGGQWRVGCFNQKVIRYFYIE